MLGLIDVVVKGVCPLIMNQLSPESYGQDTPKKSKKGSDHTSPEAREKEFNLAMYKNSKGKLYQPAEHFEKSLEIAGNQFKFTGRQTYGKLICAGIVIEPNEIIHKNQKVERLLKFVRIPPKTGAKVLKCRAILPTWELEFKINVINDSINFDTLGQVLEYAGSYVGVGDWRPKYGRFEVTKFKKS